MKRPVHIKPVDFGHIEPVEFGHIEPVEMQTKPYFDKHDLMVIESGIKDKHKILIEFKSH